MFVPPKARTVTLSTQAELPATLEKLKALASEPRLRILNLLSDRGYNITEISQALGLHVATTTLHINVLEQAGLLVSEHRPATRGTQKVCARLYGDISVKFPRENPAPPTFTELSLPVGSFAAFDVAPTCGLVGPNGIIGLLDDPASFYETTRHQAELLWFHHGFVEYRFPHRLSSGSQLESLQLEVEMCSEAPLHHSDWPSDVTVAVNSTEIGTWTSPADFGGQRGKLTPSWWGSNSSQFGLLKIWQVNHEGSFIDGVKLSEVSLTDLGLLQQTFVSVRISVKENAAHVGGLNLFGQRFGNYPQDILLRLGHKQQK